MDRINYTPRVMRWLLKTFEPFTSSFPITVYLYQHYVFIERHNEPAIKELRFLILPNVERRDNVCGIVMVLHSSISALRPITRRCTPVLAFSYPFEGSRYPVACKAKDYPWKSAPVARA